jgi:hypothetical protein
MFVLIYAVWAGIGMGLTWFLPVACGWSYFPTKKPLVAGTMFSFSAISSFWYAEILLYNMNPEKDKPTVEVPLYKAAVLNYFAPDSI